MSAGFPNQMIAFEKIGVDAASGKIRWKLVDESGEEHVHKKPASPVNDAGQRSYATYGGVRRHIVELAAVTDLAEAKRLLSTGWEYKTSYPATIANVPHYILAKRE